MAVCELCNKKILPMITANKIMKKNNICRECYDQLPILVQNNISAYTPDALKKIKDYINKTHDKMIQEFKATDSIGYIYLDRHHGYLAYCDPRKVKRGKLPKNCYDIFDCNYIQECSVITHDPYMRREYGVEYLAMDVDFRCIVKNPEIRFGCLMGEGVPCEVLSYMTDEISYKEHRQLRALKENLSFLVRNNEINRQRKSNADYSSSGGTNTNNNDTAYLQATALFMLDNNFTKSDLKRQRNKLMKTFHPDTTGNNEEQEVYARKINSAYELLLNYCTE